MSGNSILLDTNIVLYLLNGNQTLQLFLDKKDVYISFITEIELLSFPTITANETKKIQSFLNEVIVAGFNDVIKMKAIELRKQYKLLLPDAIIAATSNYMNLNFISADKSFNKVKDINFILFEI